MDAFALEFLLMVEFHQFVSEGVEIPLVTTVPWPGGAHGGFEVLRKRQASRQANSIAYCERVRLLYTPFLLNQIYSATIFIFFFHRVCLYSCPPILVVCHVLLGKKEGTFTHCHHTHSFAVLHVGRLGRMRNTVLLGCSVSIDISAREPSSLRCFHLLVFGLLRYSSI
jgi:hypothetical protein